MSKALVALLIFTIVVSLGITEIFVCQKYYSTMIESLDQLQTIVQENEKDTNVEEVQSKIQTLQNEWERKKRILQMTFNHTIIKQIDQQLETIKITSKVNNFEDLNVFIGTLKKLLEETKQELYPTPGNLF